MAEGGNKNSYMTVIDWGKAAQTGVLDMETKVLKDGGEMLDKIDDWKKKQPEYEKPSVDESQKVSGSVAQQRKKFQMGNSNAEKMLLNNKTYFPAYSKIPMEHTMTGKYFNTRSGQPKFHWCLLGELYRVIPYPVRTSIELKDRDGKMFNAHFYTESTTPRTKDLALIKKFEVNEDKNPCTVAILYPYNHRFMTGAFGIRQEEEEHFKIFPSKIPTLIEEVEKLRRSQENEGKNCCVCGAENPMTCKNCGIAKYCGKVCQMAHWDEGHKKLCGYAKVLGNLSQFDFGRWEEYKDWDFFEEKW